MRMVSISLRFEPIDDVECSRGRQAEDRAAAIRPSGTVTVRATVFGRSIKDRILDNQVPRLVATVFASLKGPDDVLFLAGDLENRSMFVNASAAAGRYGSKSQTGVRGCNNQALADRRPARLRVHG